MEESELPGWLLRDDAELDKIRDENEAKDQFSNGPRQRKEVDYTDRLTEREFLMAVDEGKLDEVVAAKRTRHAQRKAEGFDDDDDDEDPEEEEEEEPKSKRNISGTPGPRKRGRPSAAHSANIHGDASFTRPNLDKKKDKFTIKVDNKTLKKMKFLINCVIKYKDNDGRVLSDPFVQLPTRRELPDYYDIIKKPIDLKRIQQRIKDSKYGSLDALEAEVELMARNTQEYNVEGSLIYDDSIVLQSVFKSARTRLEAEPADESSESGEESDEHEKSMNHSHKNKRARVEKTEKSERRSKSDRPKKKRVTAPDDDDDENDTAEDEDDNPLDDTSQPPNDQARKRSKKSSNEIDEDTNDENSNFKENRKALSKEVRSTKEIDIENDGNSDYDDDASNQANNSPSKAKFPNLNGDQFKETLEFNGKHLAENKNSSNDEVTTS